MDSNFPLDFSNFELEITNRCNLGCPRCARTDFIQQFPKAWKHSDLDLEDFKLFIFSVLDKIQIFEFKGTMGDPIFHPKFIDWIKWAKEKGKRVFIHTNGQAGKALWTSLTKHLDKNDRVIVGIDGMPDSFMTYRVNAKWKNIETCAAVLRDKVTLVWQFIHFSYNTHEIEDAKALSERLGFNEFFVLESDRWESNEDWLKPSDALDRPSFNQDIDPQCLSKPMHIVTAEGYYMPCCMLIDHRFRYKTPWAKTYAIHQNTIKDIINSRLAADFFAKLTNKSAPDYCRFNCGKCSGS
jgi:MoaA/NifB/PqqE/SkfB family radical SAM enzyme